MEKPRYFWKQCYEMPNGDLHWALCDTDSEKEGRVSCAYMVLGADLSDVLRREPVSEQTIPKRIVELLNRYGLHD